MERPVKVACVQVEPVVLDREATLDKLEKVAAEAAKQSAELVVFPETFVPVYPSSVWAKAFAGWDGRADADSRLFRAAEEIHRRAYEAVVTAALQGTSLPASEFHWYDNDPTLLAALRATPEAWRKAGLGDRDAVLGAAVRGVTLEGTWGEHNRLAVKHPFGRGVGPLAWLFNPPRPPLSGCARCVRVATPGFGQSMRFVVDFADPEATTLVLALGTSGHLGSPHRTDQMRDWLEGDPDGQRTRLHAPPVGAPLVFAP